MHKSRLAALVIDCGTDDLERDAAFWGGALGHAVRGSGKPEDRNYRKLEAPDSEPQMLVQKVDHPSRVHLDIETDNIDAEVARLEDLGAKRVEKVRDWWVMEAPSGHRFCVVPPQRADFQERANRWGRREPGKNDLDLE